MGDEVRADIEAAFDQVEGNGGEGAAVDTGGNDPAGGADNAAPLGDASGGTEQVAGVETGAAPAGDSEQRVDRGDGRDQHGRFIGKAGAQPAVGEPAKPAVPDATAAPAPLYKAPASWKPELQQHWPKVPPEVQSEIARREHEVGRALQESSQARQVVQAMQNVYGRFSNEIQAAGGDALGMTAQFFQAHTTLSHGTPANKATLIADLIKNYGVDVGVLDGVLAGRPVQDDPQVAIESRMQAAIQKQLQPVMGYFQQMQQAREERAGQIQAEADNSVGAFKAQPGHEHFERVRDDMADLMARAAERKLTLTLQEAYDRSVALYPDLAGSAFKAQEAARIKAQADAAQRAKRAASSLPSGGAPVGTPGATAPSNTVADDLRASWDRVESAQR